MNTASSNTSKLSSEKEGNEGKKTARRIALIDFIRKMTNFLHEIMWRKLEKALASVMVEKIKSKDDTYPL